MNLQHVNAKIPVDGQLGVDPGEFIKIFHRWVADQSMDELLIDVADYRHVPAGPGVMLIGLDADYSLDNQRHRCGLLYNRKAPLEGSNEDRLLQAFRSAAKACTLLESELAGLRFSRQELELFFNDRALAPNNEATFEYCQQMVPAFLEKQFAGNSFQIEYHRDPRSRFGLNVQFEKPIEF